MANKRREFIDDDDDIEDGFGIERKDEELPAPRPKVVVKKVREVEDDEDGEEEDFVPKKKKPAKKAPPKKRRIEDDDLDDLDDLDEDDDEDDDDDRPVRKARRVKFEEDDDDDEDEDDDDEDEPVSARAVPSPIRRAPGARVRESSSAKAKRGAIRREMEHSYSVPKQVLLTLVTFGIWYFIWLARTTKYLNGVKGTHNRSVATCTVLSIFFAPFYQPFWMYNTALRVDKLANERGITCDLATLSVFVCFSPVGLALGLLLYPALSFALQGKINRIVEANVEKITNEKLPEEIAAQTAKEKLMQEAAIAASGDETAKMNALLKYKEMLEKGRITPSEYSAIERKFMTE